MKFLSFFCFIIFVSAPSRSAAFEGFWSGLIETPGTPLGIEVELTKNDFGELVGTINIPVQGLQGFALSALKTEDASIHFEMAGIPGTPTFDGTLSTSGDVIEGKFTQGPQLFPFKLERTEKVSANPSATQTGTPGEGIVGDWGGTLKVGAVELRLALHLAENDDGALSGTLDSLDQGVNGLVIDSFDYDAEAGTLEFGISRINGSFSGALNANGSALEGTWMQAGRESPLVFYRGSVGDEAKRPQEPKPPFPYYTESVQFENTTDDVTLAGTLTVPSGEGSFPAVLFITGSGPQDRDETLMGHKPFWVIADYLARRGIASLRYDDRGVGESGGDHMESTVEAFARDASAGIDFLVARPEVATGEIGIIGHSEGGLSGPIVAGMNKAVDFLVLLAPPGEPLADLIVRQNADFLRLAGVSDDLIDRLSLDQKEAIAVVRDSSLSAAEMTAKLREIVKKQGDALSEEEKQAAGYDPAMIEQNIRVSTSPWFRSLMNEDPADYLRKVTIPTLALFGSKDLQVDAEVNRSAVEDALATAGNPDVTARIFENLNHLFQHTRTGGMEEYGKIEETIAPEVLETIGDWILQRFPVPSAE